MSQELSQRQVATEAARAAEGLSPALLQAIADPTRLKLLYAIHAAPASPVKDLAEASGIMPNTATQALKALRESGLVSCHRDGRESRWQLADQRTHRLLHHLGAPHSSFHPAHHD